MSKFTPGEWWIGDSYEGEREGYLGIHSPTWGALAEVCTETSEGEKIEEGIANACLISAAPDMYEALKQCQKLFGNVLADDRPSTTSVVSVVEQALAKADGK